MCNAMLSAHGRIGTASDALLLSRTNPSCTLPRGSVVTNLLVNTMQETWVQFLGWEDPLDQEMATHSSFLAWGIPWKEEPGGLQFTGWQKSETWLRKWTTTNNSKTFHKYHHLKTLTIFLKGKKSLSLGKEDFSLKFLKLLYSFKVFIRYLWEAGKGYTRCFGDCRPRNSYSDLCFLVWALIAVKAPNLD